jgi:hypothetical protein
MERKALEERRAQIETGEQSAAQDMLKYLELAETLPLSYEIGIPTKSAKCLNQSPRT